MNSSKQLNKLNADIDSQIDENNLKIKELQDKQKYWSGMAVARGFAASSAAGASSNKGESTSPKSVSFRVLD